MKDFIIRAPRRSEAKELAALMLALWPEEGAEAFDLPLPALRRHVCDGPRGVRAR